MSGYIRLNRKFFEHSFWMETRTLSLAEAWLDLIRSARFEVAAEKVVIKMNVITINRGELRASQRYLAKRWKWSIGKVNRYIKMLEDERMIERRYEHSETIIRLCNYDDYNPVSNDKMNTNKNSNENSDGSPTKQRQIQTKEPKESKEGKEYKKRLLSELTSSDFDNPEYFEITISFWELFKKNYEELGISIITLLRANGKWVDHVRLLFENDGHSIEDVRIVFKFLQQNSFWKKNIVSTDKLRKQFSRLLMESKTKANGNSKKGNPATSDAELVEVLKKHFD